MSIPEAAIPWAKSFITKMDISNNDLTTLPEAVYDTLASLEELDVSGNCIWELSPKIKQLTALKSLNIYGNLLESLPDEVVGPPRHTLPAWELCCVDSRFADLALSFKTHPGVATFRTPIAGGTQENDIFRLQEKPNIVPAVRSCERGTATSTVFRTIAHVQTCPSSTASNACDTR